MDRDAGYQQRQDGLIITAVVMTVIAATFVAMRSTSRFVVIRNPGWDDYFMLSAMVSFSFVDLVNRGKTESPRPSPSVTWSCSSSCARIA